MVYLFTVNEMVHLFIAHFQKKKSEKCQEVPKDALRKKWPYSEFFWSIFLILIT